MEWKRANLPVVIWLPVNPGLGLLRSSLLVLLLRLLFLRQEIRSVVCFSFSHCKCVQLPAQVRLIRAVATWWDVMTRSPAAGIGRCRRRTGEVPDNNYCLYYEKSGRPHPVAPV